MEEARKVQECDEKSLANIKSKSAQVETKDDELAALKSQVAKLTATLKAAKVNGPAYKGKKNGKDGRDLKGPEKMQRDHSMGGTNLSNVLNVMDGVI